MGKSSGMLMDAIGGYFELELRKSEHFHKNALRLNTARNCFEYILLARKYTKVYIPYYTCEVMLQPLYKHGVCYEFYSLNDRLEPIEIPQLHPNEAYLYTNYYGLKQSCVEFLARIYGNQLIVDNAQAFFAPRIDGIDTLYSPRKFLGVPDGGYLYTDIVLQQDFVIDESYHRIQHLLIRMEAGAEKGYPMFKKADESLDNQPIHKMSILTERILQNADYPYIIKKRKENFSILRQSLSESNKLAIEEDDNAVPMIYPYLTKDCTLRNRLIENKIFVATYWQNVFDWCSSDSFEYKLAENMIPLPIDQRYAQKDIDKILKIIRG